VYVPVDTHAHETLAVAAAVWPPLVAVSVTVKVPGCVYLVDVGEPAPN
jgi:hypothetical protein